MGVTEGSKRLKGGLLSHISHGVFCEKVGEKKMRYVRNKQIPVDETWNREEADKLVKGYVDDVIGQNPPGLSSWASSRGLMPIDDQLDTAYEKQELVGIRSAIDALTKEWYRLTAWKIEAEETVFLIHSETLRESRRMPVAKEWQAIVGQVIVVHPTPAKAEKAWRTAAQGECHFFVDEAKELFSAIESGADVRGRMLAKKTFQGSTVMEIA